MNQLRFILTDSARAFASAFADTPRQMFYPWVEGFSMALRQFKRDVPVEGLQRTVSATNRTIVIEVGRIEFIGAVNDMNGAKSMVFPDSVRVGGVGRTQPRMIPFRPLPSAASAVPYQSALQLDP
jgi:hypothetical protein